MKLVIARAYTVAGLFIMMTEVVGLRDYADI